MKGFAIIKKNYHIPSPPISLSLLHGFLCDVQGGAFYDDGPKELLLVRKKTKPDGVVQFGRRRSPACARNLRLRKLKPQHQKKKVFFCIVCVCLCVFVLLCVSKATLLPLVLRARAPRLFRLSFPFFCVCPPLRPARAL